MTLNPMSRPGQEGLIVILYDVIITSSASRISNYFDVRGQPKLAKNKQAVWSYRPEKQDVLRMPENKNSIELATKVDQFVGPLLG